MGTSDMDLCYIMIICTCADGHMHHSRSLMMTRIPLLTKDLCRICSTYCTLKQIFLWAEHGYFSVVAKFGRVRTPNRTCPNLNLAFRFGVQKITEPESKFRSSVHRKPPRTWTEPNLPITSRLKRMRVLTATRRDDVACVQLPCCCCPEMNPKRICLTGEVENKSVEGGTPLQI